MMYLVVLENIIEEKRKIEGWGPKKKKKEKKRKKG